jgi:predicted Abi (CAAX) family protease
MRTIQLIWTHFFADFVLQSDWMARGKSKKMLPLLVHILIYSACFIPFGIRFAALNGLAHLATDFCTSRVTSKLWAAQKVHWFFVVIGLDQAIHFTCLVSIK